MKKNRVLTLPIVTSEMVRRMHLAEPLTNQEMQSLYIFYSDISYTVMIDPRYVLMAQDAAMRSADLRSVLRAKKIVVPSPDMQIIFAEEQKK